MVENLVLPVSNATNNITENNIVSENIDYEHLQAPAIPRFIIIWGYIGAATYALKVSVKKTAKDEFNDKYILEHFVRLIIGTVTAIVVFFILVTGGFFGLTIDVNKLASTPVLIPYVYGAVSFLSGYSVRGVIEIISGISESIFVYAKER